MKRALSFILIAVLIIASAAFAEAGLPTKWDLTTVYPSVEAWEADWDEVMALLEQYESFRGTLKDAQSIYDFFQFKYFSRLTELQDKLRNYVELGLILNAADPVYGELDARLSLMDYVEDQYGAFADEEIYAIPLDERAAIFSGELFKPYAYFLKNYVDPNRQPLDESASAAKATLSMALGYTKDAYELMKYVEMPYPTLTMPDGSELPMDDDNYRRVVYSDGFSNAFKDEATRLYYARPKPYIHTLTKLLEGHVAQAYANALLDHYETTREARMALYDVNPKVYDLVIKAAHKGAEDHRRYLAAHARGLGIQTQKSYDLYHSVSEYDPGFTSYDDAVAEIRAALGLLGDEYLGTFDAIVESGHMDVYPAEGKDTGSGTSYYDLGSLPWISVNYGGGYGDVSNLAHELGHAAYDALSTKYQPRQNCYPTTFTHEVASTLNEFLYSYYKISNAADDGEKLYYVENLLYTFDNNFFTQMVFAEFEDYFYGVVESGSALDAEALCDKYEALSRRYTGNALSQAEEHRYRWAEIPHLYYTYYVYTYATSVCYAASIARRILSGEPGAVEDYLAFLKAGRSADPQALLSLAGLDPLSPETYELAMAFYAGLVDEYERLIDAR